MIRVLLVGKGEPDRGGIAAFLRLLLSSRLAQRHDLSFLNVAHAGTPAGGRVTTGNVRRTVVDTLAVWRRSRRTRIVHIHSALAPAPTVLRAGLFAAAARARRCRVIVHAHGGQVQLWLTTPLRRRIVRFALAAAHRVVAVSRGGEEGLGLALGRQRVRLVDNGVDVERFTPGGEPHDPPRILYAGLLTPRKGVLDLLEASSLLAARGVRHELWLAGGTPDEGPQSEAAVLEAVGPGTRVLGAQPHEGMPQLYRQADVFCLPSWWEAMPLSVLEAMASGLPVVATSVGDVPRLVDDATGRLVPPRRPAELADALEPLLLDSDRRRQLGAAGRARVVAAFTAEATVAAIDALYEELTDFDE